MVNAHLGWDDAERGLPLGLALRPHRGGVQMLGWIIVLYLVDVHTEIARVPHHYPTRDSCQMGGDLIAVPGVSYAICKPVSGEAQGT